MNCYRPHLVYKCVEVKIRINFESSFELSKGFESFVRFFEGTLRSGKRFRVDGKKRKSDKECKTFVDSTLLWEDSESHSVKWVRTLEKPKSLGVGVVTSLTSRSSSGTVTPIQTTTTLGGSTATSGGSSD